MRKINCFVLTVLFVGALCSCQKEVSPQTDDVTTPAKGDLQTFTARIADLTPKVSVDAGGKTEWEDGDRIVIHGHYVAENLKVELQNFSADKKEASFTADLSGILAEEGAYYVSYPADAYIGLSGEEVKYNGYYSGFNDTNHPLMAGYLDGTKLVLYNLCGVLTFKVNGDYNGYILEGNRAETVSYDAYRVKITSTGQDFKSWKTAGDKASVQGVVTSNDGTGLNYVYFPNGASFPNGFTLYLMKDGVIKGYVTSTKEMTIGRGQQKNFGLLPEGKIHARPMTLNASEAIDLNNHDGAKQTPANSYLLVRNSTYRDKTFKIWACKGNDLSQPIEGIASVEVLWESRCEGSGTLTAGFIVESLDFDKNHIYFKTPAGDDFKDGNAVIAAKDSDGKILWSWHIWVSYSSVNVISSAEVAGTAVMDRNLGALYAASTTEESKVTSYGLLYQWGRKDPFLGARYVTDGRSPDYVSNYSFSFQTTQMTLDESIEKPMTGAYVSSSDWCTSETTDRYLWSNSKKTIYDPCPSGYRVMKYDSSTQVWSEDSTYKDNLANVDGWNMYNTFHSFTLGSNPVVFTLTGYRDGVGNLNYVGSRAAIWSSYASSSGDYASFLNIRYDKTQYNRTSTERSRFCSVRCVAE